MMNMIEEKVGRNSEENGMIMKGVRKEEVVIHETFGIEKGSMYNAYFNNEHKLTLYLCFIHCSEL